MVRLFFLSLLTLITIHAAAQPLDLLTFEAGDGEVLINDTNEVTRLLSPVSGVPGDLNGDGIDDYAHSGFTLDGFTVGNDVFVVFGDAGGFPFPLGLASLDGGNGFVVTDSSELLQGWIAIGPAGDVNDDGLADMVLTARDDQPSPTKLIGAVIFGRDGDFPATLDVADLDGSNGFLLSDPDSEVSAPPAPLAMNQPGDLNCDGVDDLVLGFPEAGSGGEVRVLFGGEFTISANVGLSGFDGSNGVVIQAPVDAVDFGFALAGLGDFDGDGCRDLAIGDPNAPGPVSGGSGRVSIVFGDDNPGHPFDAGSLNGSNGMTIESDAPDLEVNALGTRVAGGDFDGDTRADLLVGAPGGTSVGGQAEEGGALIIYGRQSNPALLLVRHAGGERVSATRGYFSELISSNPGGVAAFVSVGDFNGDGLADAAISALNETPVEGRPGAGVVYALFGQSGGLAEQIALDTLASSPARGFVVYGAESADGAGATLATGDFNGDGSAELAIGGDTIDFPAGSGTGAIFWIRGTNNDVIFDDDFEG